MLKKIITLFTGSAIGKASQFVYFFWIVSLLSKHEFGQYAVSMTLFLIILYPILEFGTELLIHREAAKQNTDFFYHVLYWKLLIFPFTALLISLVGILAFNIQFSVLMLSAGLILLRSLENGNAACLRGRDLSHVESRHIICSRVLSIVFLAAVVFGLNKVPTIEWVIGFQILGILASILTMEARYLWRFPLPGFNLQYLKQVLSQGFPLALNSVGWLIYYKIDVLLLGKILSNSDAGSYEVAFKIMEATFILPIVIMGVAFRSFVTSQTKEEYNRSFLRILLLLCMSGVMVAVISVLILPVVFPLVFDDYHVVSIEIYQVLALAIPFVYMAHLTTQSLVIQNQSYRYLRITLAGALLNLCLNLPLIHFFQLFGAAVATVVTEIFILAASGFFLFRSAQKEASA